MSSTEPASSSTSPLSTPPTTSVTNNSPNAVLGKDDFLKLLVDQLKNQDPTSPTDSSTFMAQLAQFSSLAQQTNMSQTLTGLASTDAVTQGVDLIGRNLTFTRTDGSSGTGIAQAITVAGGAVVIDVGGENVDPADVTAVSDAPATPSSGS